MDKRIGAQYYTIRDFCQTLDDFEKSCEKVSTISKKRLNFIKSSVVTLQGWAQCLTAKRQAAA